jgi:hypothetical protein
VPTISLLVGMTCLLVGVWAAAEASRATKGQPVTFIVLALLGLGTFGSLARVLFQLAALHGFYRPAQDIQRIGPMSTYWGVMILLIATAGVACPMIVVVSTLMPKRIGPVWYRKRVTSLAKQTTLLLVPLAATVLLVGIFSLLPAGISGQLGYSAPRLGSSRQVYGISEDNLTAWVSLERVAFLPLLVGMWAGMETARACFDIGERRLAGVASRLGDWRVGAAIAGVIVLTATIRTNDYILPLAALTMTTLVGLSSAGITQKLLSISTVRSGARWGFSTEWQAAAPIGQILFILALPALFPVARDLWLGLAGPFQLPGDAVQYIPFWTEPPITQVKTVTVDGIFTDQLQNLALYGCGVVALCALGIVFTRVIGDKAEGAGKSLWALLRVTGLAFCFVVLVRRADIWTTGPLIALCALPVLIFVFRLAPERKTINCWKYLGYTTLLGIWALSVNYYGLLPTYGVIGATIIWRFAINAGELNMEVPARRADKYGGSPGKSDQERNRQIALFPDRQEPWASVRRRSLRAPGPGRRLHRGAS